MFFQTKKMCVRRPLPIRPDNPASEDLPTERTDGQWDLAFRLYRRVTETDDGSLLPSPYMNPASVRLLAFPGPLGRWCRPRSYLDSAAAHGITTLDAISSAIAGKPRPPPREPGTGCHPGCG
jgi:hypothetical protein